MKPLPIVIADSEGAVVSTNRAGATMLDATVGRRCSDVVCVRSEDGRSVCTTRCAQELQHAPGQQQRHRGRVRGRPHEVVCSKVGDQVVITLAPAAAPLRAMDSLTPRELQVLALVAKGKTSNQIAAVLGISFATVRTHVEHARAKLGSRNRAEAVARALALGLLPR